MTDYCRPADFVNVMNSFEMTLNRRHNSIKLRYRNMKNQSTEKQKPAFIK